jgi:septal ring factor EnvC (AmiA/AmiB activator)
VRCDPRIAKQDIASPFAAVVAASLVLAASVWGASTGDEQAKLDELRRRIETLQRSLNEIHGREAAVRSELADLERRIGKLIQDRTATDARLAAARRQRQGLERRLESARREFAKQRALLAAYLRAAYASGRQPTLKLILDQEDPAALARVLTYYRYFNAAWLARLEAVRASLAHLEALEGELRAREQELAALRDAQAQQRHALEAARARRATLLTALRRQARDTAEEIERLRADERRLAELVGRLQSYLADLPHGHETKQHFGELRGRLALPVAGRVLARYGQERSLGRLRWQGVWLAAREGEPVRAVFRGRVAYADWLRGFGLLLILDHGDGYMTLYGHNQSLLKQVGDWVETGEVIAQAGSTGDASRPGLYFEVRRHGEPHDPLLWCRAP